MKKIKHPHRKALIRQKYQKRKPKVTYERCRNFYGCEQCPFTHAGFRCNVK